MDHDQTFSLKTKRLKQMLRYSGDVECRHCIAECRLGNEAADDSVRTPNSTDTLHSPVVRTAVAVPYP